jgi:hypothetical protein
MPCLIWWKVFHPRYIGAAIARRIYFIRYDRSLYSIIIAILELLKACRTV